MPLPAEVLNTVSAIVEAGSSINLYMFHGGTNFGFIGGALHFQDYKPDVTSYGSYPRQGTHTTPRHFRGVPQGQRLAPPT